MRILKLNSTIVDIDDNTSIGIDYQAYDIKQPGKRFVNVSNTFSIPKTALNMSVIGNAGNPQSLSTTVYSINYCSYWVDNQIFIDNAKWRVDSVSDRIYIFIFEKADIWDRLKEDNWSQTTAKYILYLINEKGLYSGLTTPFTGSFSDFVDEYIESTEDLVLLQYYSNLRALTKMSGGLAENLLLVLLRHEEEVDGTNVQGYGAHWNAYVKSLFEFIEFEYDVNFLTAGGQVDGNIWDDTIANQLSIQMPDIRINASGTSGSCTVSFTTMGPNDIFQPYTDIKDKPDKTLYDLVVSFIKHLNLIVDTIEVNNEKVYALRRFDQLEADADIVDWSGLTGQKTFKPIIDGYGQNNYIKFKIVYDTGSALLNSRNITSLNKNADFKVDLFEIDAYVPPVITVNADVCLDLSAKEAFKTFTFMLPGEYCSTIRSVAYATSPGTVISAGAYPKLAVLYDLNSEYLLLESAMQYPIYYEVEKWLRPSDIRNLTFFKLYYFKELNGSFFLNKITGFNPDKSNQPTKLELLRISDKTPTLAEDIAFWSDGEDNIFTNGNDEYLY